MVGDRTNAGSNRDRAADARRSMMRAVDQLLDRASVAQVQLVADALAAALVAVDARLDTDEASIAAAQAAADDAQSDVDPITDFAGLTLLARDGGVKVLAYDAGGNFGYLPGTDFGF